MDLGLTGKNALVLASSRGLGRGVAAALVAEGARILICGRNAERLAAAAEKMTESGPGTACYMQCDLADADAATRLYGTATDKLGAIDILVNNTDGPPPGGILEPTAEQWRGWFDIMVLRIMEITGLIVPGMRKRKWGRILTIASRTVVEPVAYLAMSNTLRSALVGWSKTLATEVAPDNVTVNMLLPGRIHTRRVDRLDAARAEHQGKSIDEVRSATQAAIPMGRYGRVEELAAIAAFVASSPASYITGTLIRCDGGATRSV